MYGCHIQSGIWALSGISACWVPLPEGPWGQHNILVGYLLGLILAVEFGVQVVDRLLAGTSGRFPVAKQRR